MVTLSLPPPASTGRPGSWLLLAGAWAALSAKSKLEVDAYMVWFDFGLDLLLNEK